MVGSSALRNGRSAGTSSQGKDSRLPTLTFSESVKHRVPKEHAWKAFGRLLPSGTETPGCVISSTTYPLKMFFNVTRKRRYSSPVSRPPYTVLTQSAFHLAPGGETTWQHDGEETRSFSSPHRRAEPGRRRSCCGLLLRNSSLRLFSDAAATPFQSYAPMTHGYLGFRRQRVQSCHARFESAR